MRRDVSCRKILFCAFICLIGWSLQAQAGEARHINFAAFQKNQPGFEFDPIVAGKFSDFIQAMDGAQILILSHTSDAVDGDVLNFQQDVLREGKDGMVDNGINCSLTLRIEGEGSSPEYTIGGLCRIFRGGSSAQKITAIIPPASLPDTAQGFDGWIELYEDQKNGIAFYANVSTGH
jgi:hypothetical protein